MDQRIAITTLFPYTTLFRSLEHRIKCGFSRNIGYTQNIAVVAHPGDRTLVDACGVFMVFMPHAQRVQDRHGRSEEHTSELQSRGHLVCRLLLEKRSKCTFSN